MKDKRKIIINVLLFIILLYITYYIIFYIIFNNQNPKQFIHNFDKVNINFVILSFFVMFLYFIIEGYNIKVLLKSLNEKISILQGIKYTMIGFFFSAITPAASGGQPMEIYYMSKDDIKVSHATISLLIHLFGYQFSVVFLGIICSLLNTQIFDTKLTILFIIGTLLNSISLFLTFVGIFSKSLSKRIINLAKKIIKFFNIKNSEYLNEKISKEYLIYTESSTYILKHKKQFIMAVFRAFLQVIILNSCIFFTYKSFGLNTYNYFELLQIQLILSCSVTSIPLPGSIGISESVFIMIYEAMFGLLLTNALLINRFISFYSYVLICMFVVLINKMVLIIKDKKKENILKQ